jgi:hypothetical protein
LVIVCFWFLGNRWNGRRCSGDSQAFAQRLLTGKMGTAGEWLRPARSGRSTLKNAALLNVCYPFPV